MKVEQHDEIEALKAEIHNDVERTFPEDSFFQQPHVKQSMERILLTWTQHDDKSRKISYRQGMNSLLAILLLAHTRDAASKARALRIYLTKMVDVSVVNALHAEYLRAESSCYSAHQTFSFPSSTSTSSFSSSRSSSSTTRRTGC